MHVIIGTASLLSHDYDVANFDFYGKVLSGTTQQRDRWRRGVSLVNGVCGEDVGREYVKRHFPESSKQRMGQLVDNLIDAYRVSITNSDWLGEETKAKALEKLSKFTPMIGYTERWRDYTAFDVHADAGLVANMQAAALYEWGFQLSKAGKPVDKGEWLMNPQTVNAYYEPSMNVIVFPAAILQPPFFNPDAEDAANYDLKQLALECATKRMYPDVIFYENIVNITGSFKAPMGCRSFLQGWIDPKTGKDVEDGRMNLGVVTVNIPRIALESHGDKDRFWKIFDERMAVAHQALQFRIMRCKQATPVNAPTLFRFGAFGRLGANDSVDQLFRNERATVSLGYIGLYEATSVFYGKDWMRDHDWDPEGKEFALSIVKRMNELCKDWSTAEGYHYSVYSTPAESLTDRFNRMDREKFGEVDGVTDHDFYTNSFHYPVWLQPTPMEKLDYEKDFPYYASGGFINYCEFPCLQANPKALEAVWDYAYTIGIGYLGTNTPIDRCYECGFEGDFEPTEEGFKCPECGNSDPDRCNVTKRTCGYLGNPVQRPMVHGRHEEIAHRVKHMSGETGHVTLDDGSEREWFEEAK